MKMNAAPQIAASAPGGRSRPAVTARIMPIAVQRQLAVFGRRGRKVRKRRAGFRGRRHNAAHDARFRTPATGRCRARDARFDGRFFVAVSSTRIYCRPVCTVKPPQARELPLLSERGGRGVGRLPALPALPAGARARQRERGRDLAPGAGRGEPDRGPRAGRRTGWTPSPRASASPTGTCAARSAPSSASRRWSSRRRSACCSPSAC